MEIAQEEVSIPVAGAPPLAAHFARPRGAGPEAARRPALVVIHEILGLNDDIRRIAARFSACGYPALAPDLFAGRGPRVLCIARAVTSLRRREGPAFADLDAALAWLAARPEADPTRLGVVGFCLGGGFALALALRAGLRVAAPFYGDVPAEAEALRGICPVVGGYGGRDRVFGPQGERLVRHLETLGVPHDVRVYPEAGHSFMSQHPPGWMLRLGAIGPMRVGYDEACAEDSWRRMLAFFERHLAA